MVEGSWVMGKLEAFAICPGLCRKGNFFLLGLPNRSNPSQGPFFSLQTWNNCDITGLGLGICEVANVLRITLGRGEITIFTPPISLSGASTLQNKSQCLSPNLVWQRVAAYAIPGPLWCQSPISPMTFFFKERVDFLETLPFATSTVYSCTQTRGPPSHPNAVALRSGKRKGKIKTVSG